jgi:TRAP-type C4-dicarboxylate transport system permease small subunit
MDERLKALNSLQQVICVAAAAVLAFGGWPTYNHFCVQHFHRGCPILAFFARVGVDDACAIGFVT